MLHCTQLGEVDFSNEISRILTDYLTVHGVLTFCSLIYARYISMSRADNVHVHADWSLIIYTSVVFYDVCPTHLNRVPTGHGPPSWYNMA